MPDTLSATRSLLLAVGILAGAIAPAAGAAETVYRWVDRDGVVNYSERPPSPGQGERVRGEPAAPVDPRRNAFLDPPREVISTPAVPSSPAPRGPSPAQDPRYAELEAERLARAEAIEEERERRCEQFRLAFDRLTATDRIRIQDEAGNQRIIGEDERQGRIQRAQEGIVEFCEP